MTGPLRPPPIPETVPPHVVPGARRIHVRSLLGLAEFLASLGVVVSGGGGGGGGGLSGGLVLTDTPTVTWDFTTPGEAKATAIGSGAGGFAPTRIPPGETFTVPGDTQVLIALPIEVDGALVVAGALVEVDGSGVGAGGAADPEFASTFLLMGG